jgi:hypothetical protein
MIARTQGVLTNKYLLMSAAALLASTAAASAGERQFQFGSVFGGSYCDGETGYWSGANYQWVHTNADCAGATGIGNPGIEGKTPTLGKVVDMTDTYTMQNPGACSYVFPSKFRLGGKWSFVCNNLDGTKFKLKGGVLASPNANAGDATKSSLSTVKAMLAERARQSK